MQNVALFVQSKNAILPKWNNVHGPKMVLGVYTGPITKGMKKHSWHKNVSSWVVIEEGLVGGIESGTSYFRVCDPECAVSAVNPTWEESKDLKRVRMAVQKMKHAGQAIDVRKICKNLRLKTSEVSRLVSLCA